jgi:hypothetical protein
MPRPATIRISVAMIGCIPDPAEQADAERGEDHEGERLPRGDHRGRGGAGDGDRGADREVDPARRDHERHADGEKRHRGGADEHVDRAAVKAAVLEGHGEKARRDEGDRGEDERERHELRCQPAQAGQ